MSTVLILIYKLLAENPIPKVTISGLKVVA